MFPLTSNEAYIKSTGKRSTLGDMFDGLSSGKASTKDLTSISITGTINNTGQTITAGTYFYLNGVIVKANTNIANGATLTNNTNYVEVPGGALNDYEKTEWTRFGTDGAGNRAAYRKIGRMLELRSIPGSFTELTANTWHNLGTLPDGFVPEFISTYSIAIPIISKSTIGNIGLLEIQTSGVVRVYSTSTIDALSFEALIPLN